MKDTLIRLFEYKAWANDELLSALAKLEDRPLVMSLAIRAMSHSYVVDRIFASHLRRQSHSYSSANLSQLPGLNELSVQTRASDKEFVSYVLALDSGELEEFIDFEFTDGQKGRMTRIEMLMHLITHGVGHRGQVSAVMLLNSVTPATDGFATFLHKIEPLARGRAGG